MKRFLNEEGYATSSSHMAIFLEGMIIFKFNAKMVGPVSFTQKNEVGIKFIKENTEHLELGFSQTTGVPFKARKVLNH